MGLILPLTWLGGAWSCLARNDQKNQSPDTRGAGKWWLRRCTVVPATESALFWHTLYISFLVNVLFILDLRQCFSIRSCVPKNQNVWQGVQANPVIGGKLIKWSGINHDQPWQLLLLLLQLKKKNHSFPRFWNLQTTTSNISLPSQSNWDYMKMHNLVAMYATNSWSSNLAKCKT